MRRCELKLPITKGVLNMTPYEDYVRTFNYRLWFLLKYVEGFKFPLYDMYANQNKKKNLQQGQESI